MNALFVNECLLEYLSMYSSILFLFKEIHDLTSYDDELKQLIRVPNMLLNNSPGNKVHSQIVKCHSIFS
jgi:hypothetical protein